MLKLKLRINKLKEYNSRKNVKYFSLKNEKSFCPNRGKIILNNQPILKKKEDVFLKIYEFPN